MKIRSWIRFLGPHSVWYMILSLGTSFGLFACDLAFAYSLQLFLAAIGLVSWESIKLPAHLNIFDFASRFGQDAHRLDLVMGLLFTTALIKGVGQWSQNTVQGLMVEHFKLLQRKRLMERVFSSQSGDSAHAAAFFSEMVTQAASFLYAAQGTFVYAMFSIFVLATLLKLSVLITVVFLVEISVVMTPVYFMLRHFKRNSEKLNSEWDQTNRRLLISLKNLMLIRIYGMAKLEKERSMESLYRGAEVMKSVQKIGGVFSTLPQIAGFFCLCSIMVMMRPNHWLGSGILLSYFYLINRLLQTISSTSGNFSSVVFCLPRVREVYTWWQQGETEKVKQSHQKNMETHPAAQLPIAPVGWRVKKLHFQFQGTAAPLFRGIDFDIHPGGCHVFVGTSGSGKSTLLELLLGLRSPNSGTIEIVTNGQSHPIAEFKDQLSQRIGYVGAESYLIPGSVKENICYGLKTEPTREEIETALQLADCEFVNAFPGGLEHQITEQGQGLSSGQKQRLALCRALLRKPLVLILDEATANLDFDTEVRLVERFSLLKGKVTIVAVTHRKELLRIADSVLKLNGVGSIEDSAKAA